MANENMIKFYRGPVNNLPAAGANGALYVTTDEGAIYYGTGDGMKRLGDFVQVSNVASLPEKAHESCLYYCVAENILAKWNGTEWKQINKQPDIETLKTQLGLGSLAYLSEVSEANLDTSLKEKVNAAAEGNHAHLNKTVLDGITAEKVAAWDNAEKNAKDYADGKDSAMNTRVEALETAIGENGSVATQIKTAIEALDFTDTAVDGEYVSAVNEVDGKISVTRKALPDYSNTYDVKGAAETALNNAKAYADGLAANYDEKGAAASVKTELEAEIAKKVDKVDGKDLIATSEIERLATLANYDDTQVKADIAKKADAETMTTELGKKVDKVEGCSLVSDTEIERLAGVSNYDDTTVKADIAKKADAETMMTELGKKVDKVEGYSLVSDDEIARLAEVDNYNDEEVRGLIGDNADSISALAGKVGTVPEGQTVMGIITNIQENAYDDTELRGLISDNTDAIDAIEADYLKAADKTELSGLITAEKERAEGIEGGLETRLAAVEGDYLKAADKEALQTQINTIMNNPDAEGAINSINEFTQYVKDHGTIAEGMRTDINKNKEDIAAINNADTGILKQAKDYADGLAGNYAEAEHDHVVADITDFDTAVATKVEAYGYATTGYADQAEADAKAYADAEVAKDRARLDTLEAIDHNAYVAADATLKSELQDEIDADVKALADGQVATNKNDIASIMEMLTWGSF